MTDYESFEETERSRSSRKRKNTRRWCRGKVGVEHVPGEPFIYPGLSSLPKAHCGWRANTLNPEGRVWSCIHVTACINCGKHLHFFEAEHCPDRPA